MPLPAVLGPFTNLPAAPAAAAAPAGALAFVMQPQAQTEWCWAATTASVAAFYAAKAPGAAAAAPSQCQVASTCLGQGCCDAPGPCNLTYYLDRALTAAAHMAGEAVAGPLDFSPTAGGPAVTTEIDAGRPIGCHVTWTNGQGHFNAIFGYDPATQDVDVADPFYGVTTLPYQAFVSDYQNDGAWDYSYLTE